MSTRAGLATRLASSFLLLAISTGCTPFRGAEPEAPRAPTNHSVTLSHECERLAVNVDDPVVEEPVDPWRSIGEYAVALGEANGNIDATRECQGQQRKRLAKGKKR